MGLMQICKVGQLCSSYQLLSRVWGSLETVVQNVFPSLLQQGKQVCGCHNGPGFRVLGAHNADSLSLRLGIPCGLALVASSIKFEFEHGRGQEARLSDLSCLSLNLHALGPQWWLCPLKSPNQLIFFF